MDKYGLLESQNGSWNKNPLINLITNVLKEL